MLAHNREVAKNKRQICNSKKKINELYFSFRMLKFINSKYIELIMSKKFAKTLHSNKKEQKQLAEQAHTKRQQPPKKNIRRTKHTYTETVLSRVVRRCRGRQCQTNTGLQKQKSSEYFLMGWSSSSSSLSSSPILRNCCYVDFLCWSLRGCE